MKDRDTAVYKIFHNYYEITMPQHHLYSKEYIETFGIPTSGDTNVDRELANTQINARRTIAQMAELISEGATLTLIDPKQSVEIYSLIRDYLRQWDAKIKNSPVAIDAPLEDIRKLDELARELYPIASRYIGKDEAVSAFDKFSRKTGLGITRAQKRAESKASDNSDSEYKSIADGITKEAFSKQRTWG